MAYNRRYNPDSLPAHAEPEEAAQIIGRTNSTTRDSNYVSRQDSYANRPQPPTPSQSSRQDGRSSASLGRQDSRTDNASYDRRQPPPNRTDSYSRREDGRSRQDDGRYRQDDSRYRQDDARPRQDEGRQRPSESDPRRRYEQQSPPAGYSSRQPPPPSRTSGPDENELWRMFKTVDRDRSGQLSEEELGTALVNGDYTLFDPHTVKMMIRMFDVDRSGTISFNEFCLWAFLGDWRKLFDRFDVDRSGTISYEEFSDALVAFGYRLSPDYVRILFNSYDFRGRGVLSFDLFVQSCISLKRMTEVFKKYDTDRDGYITLSFEQFLAGFKPKIIPLGKAWNEVADLSYHTSTKGKRGKEWKEDPKIYLRFAVDKWREKFK